MNFYFVYVTPSSIQSWGMRCSQKFNVKIHFFLPVEDPVPTLSTPHSAYPRTKFRASCQIPSPVPNQVSKTRTTKTSTGNAMMRDRPRNRVLLV
jgi:hypothetical protein